MQRLQSMRMLRTLSLAPVIAVGLTAACAGGGEESPAGAMQPASEAAPSAGGAGTAAAAPSGADKSASGDTAKAPAQGTKPPAAAGGSAAASANQTTGAASQTNTAAPSAGGAAGAAAEAPDGSAAEATAGASGGAAANPEQAAAGSGDTGAQAAAGAAGEAGPMAMLTEDGIDPLNPDWTKRTDLGKGDGSDVVTIGDSWMDYVGGGGGIEAGLDRSGTNYRHYGLSATTLLSGQIPGQYTRAKGVNPDIKTVIMTGGGNDVMFSGGCNTPERCEESVAAIQAGLDELWTEMAADGVKDVIYIQYSADAGTAPTGNRPKETKPVPICLTGKILCHTLPTTDLVMGQLVDGIHPTASANTRIAEALIKMMEERKMRR